MISSGIKTGIPLKNFTCGNITFGIYKDEQKNDNPIILVKDVQDNIIDFSNSIGIRICMFNISSVRVILIGFNIKNKNNKDSSFVYITHLNYHTDIGYRFMNSILRNPSVVIVFFDEKMQSHNGLSTIINKDNSINGMVTKLDLLMPWTKRDYIECKRILFKSFESTDIIWEALNENNPFNKRRLI